MYFLNYSVNFEIWVVEHTFEYTFRIANCLVIKLCQLITIVTGNILANSFHDVEEWILNSNLLIHQPNATNQKPIFFFFYLGFLSRTFTNHRTAGEGEGISLTPHYHFHPLHRHLDISRAITAESSPLHITGSRTRTGNLWFPSASR